MIAQKKQGLSNSEIIKQLPQLSKGGRISRKLKNLQDAGFIMKLTPFTNKKKGVYYKVIDEFSLFYLQWIEPVKNLLEGQSVEPGYWEGLQESAAWKSWSGYAFEAICYKHLSAIRKKLAIPPTALASTWRYVPPPSADSDGAQVDLLFDRRDEVITLCEIKYTQKAFLIDKNYARELMKKQRIFIEQTKTHKQIFMTMICAGGLTENAYAADLIDGVVTLDEFFE